MVPKGKCYALPPVWSEEKKEWTHPLTSSDQRPCHMFSLYHSKNRTVEEKPMRKCCTCRFWFRLSPMEDKK
jgi:hypothetical protein